jgi:acylphosphatase
MSANEPIRAVKVSVTGCVQGVWFRDWTRHEANRYGLSGWVRNEPDRSVSAVLEGPPEKVEILLRALWSGPDLAEVRDVAARDIPAEGHSVFRILH